MTGRAVCRNYNTSQVAKIPESTATVPSAAPEASSARWGCHGVPPYHPGVCCLRLCPGKGRKGPVSGTRMGVHSRSHGKCISLQLSSVRGMTSSLAFPKKTQSGHVWAVSTELRASLETRGVEEEEAVAWRAVGPLRLSFCV